MSSEVIVNASGVDPDSLNWLMQSEDGHYFIQQQRNRARSFAHNHLVSDDLGHKIIEASKNDMRKAWEIMEEHVANSI